MNIKGTGEGKGKSWQIVQVFAGFFNRNQYSWL